MHFRLVKPVKRTGSLNHYCTQRIPADVKARAVGLKLEIPVGRDSVPKTITAKDNAIRISLRTAIPGEVKARQAQVIAYLETVWAALRQSSPLVLTFKQATALGGELYAGWAAEEAQRDTGTDIDRKAVDGTLLLSSTKFGPLEPGLEVGPNPDSWEGVIKRLEAPEADPETIVGPLVAKLLLRKGIVQIDPESRALVVRAFAEALLDAAKLRQRQAAGDYSPDPNAARFPEWVDPSAAAKPASGVSLTGLPALWWKEAKKAGRTDSTYESYSGTFKRLCEFLKHDDAAAVTPDDVVKFKDHRLAQGISLKTIRDSDLSGLKAVFGWAVTNRRLASNPAEGVKVVREKRIKLRSDAFTGDEAKAILLHANAVAVDSPLSSAKRWVPWLCAYTGARVGEIVQMRKQDLQQEGDLWVLTITPEAGTVKDKEVRKVVLHQHLVDMGLPDFVQAQRSPHVFIRPTNDVGKAVKVCKTRLAEFVREVVKDAGVQPSHAWRHTFKTIGREAGIADSVLDAICGHAAKTVGGAYGDVTLKAQAEAMGKFPRFPV
ncbi:MAG: tyrosine-type recombinase/integrase [Mesorhizobium sp.]